VKFPKTSRLLKSKQFKKILREGSRFSASELSFLYVLRNKAVPAKLGITTPKKTGKAVKRNRFKRVVREAFRLYQRILPLGFEVNISPAKAIDRITRKMALDDFALLLTSTKIPTTPQEEILPCLATSTKSSEKL
jgi:ribonuclease P protein component